MSFGPKVVDWACSLRKTKKWFRWQKLVLCMYSTPVFGMGDVRQRNCEKPLQTLPIQLTYYLGHVRCEKRRNCSGGKNSCFVCTRHPFSEWVTCDNEIARNHPKHEFWT